MSCLAVPLLSFGSRAATLVIYIYMRMRDGQVDGDVMMSSYVRSDSSPSVSWKVGSFQAFVEAKVGRALLLWL